MVRIKLWLSREVQGFIEVKKASLKAEKPAEHPSQVRPSFMLVKGKSAMTRVIRKWSAKSNEDLVSKDTEADTCTMWFWRIKICYRNVPLSS